MVHVYKVGGMSCNGCRAKVEKRLNEIEGVDAKVTLDPPQAVITMDKHITDAVFQMTLSEIGNYTIQMGGHHTPVSEHPGHHAGPVHKDHQGHGHQAVQHRVHQSGTGKSSGSGKYYCPMHCEGDKIYDKPGSCPVCGMNLEKVQELNVSPSQYTCPMHPEIVSDQPGACPICGMDLVPMQPIGEDDNKIYNELRKKFIVAIVFTIPVFILAMGEMIPGNPIGEWIPKKVANWIQLLFSLPVVFYATWMFFERAWKSFSTWNLNMFSLIGLGAGAAFVFSLVALFFPGIFPDAFRDHHGNVHLYFEAVTVILTLVLLGQLLEARAHAQTGSAIKELLKLSPTDVVLVENGIDKKISIGDIQPGDILKVKPGDKIPVDGEITEGNSNIDESMITGEPVPVEKNIGDKVSSGTINGNRSFLMKAERVGQDTLLARIIQMVNDASRSRAPIQKLADRISKYFVPTVIVIAIVTFIAWSVWGPDQKYVYALVNALAVLIVACPCALGLATPMSVMVGVGKGAGNGVLIKNAEALEQMNKVDTLITDKTGTITEGKPSLQRIVKLADLNEDELLMYAASLNQNSEHPLADAITKKAKDQHIALSAVSDFEAVSGKGVTGIINGKNIAIGNDKLMLDSGAAISEEIKSTVIAEQRQGKTVSYIAIDKHVAGFLSISDAIKATSITAIKYLMANGVDVIMLTGDNENTARAVAGELGLKHFRAQCLPEDKLNEIKKLQAEGRVVAMAGDGINDAPALAQADIGIAMGTGTDVAIESAEITLLKGDLTGIAKAKILSHKVMRNIKQNLFFAFIYNVIGIPIAAGILYPSFGILMSPMIAAAAMSLSSVSVIANSLRLRSSKIHLA